MIQKNESTLSLSSLFLSLSSLSLDSVANKRAVNKDTPIEPEENAKREKKNTCLHVLYSGPFSLFIHSFFFFFFSSLSSCHSLCTHFLSIFFSFWLRSTLSSSSSFSTIKPCHNNKVRSTCSTPKIIIWVLLFFHLNANGFVEKFAFDDLR